MAPEITQTSEIRCLFLDIGGVPLSNGWDHHARRRAAINFRIEWNEMEDRHNLNFATLEEGKLTLEEYLARVVFYHERPFTADQFRGFMFAQSSPCLEMISLIRLLRAQYGLKIIVVSNESRELNAHRIEKFKLDGLVDAFISSCFVHLRKPDLAIFQLALDIAQTPPSQVVFIDNTAMFVQIAQSLGMQGIIHIDYKVTCKELDSYGLQIDESAAHETR
jgi:putative hydrolase of the HAD superfamily